MKIRNENHLKGCIVSTLMLITCQTIFAQTIPLNRYGLPVIKDMSIYSAAMVADSNKRMVELKTIIPTLAYDLRYAGINNFMHRRMYPKKTNATFLRLPAAFALKKIQEELSTKGYGLKIFDAYRPYSVTEKFWELVKDERYVANPAKGSGHNRGIAVDLTIIELATRKELDMGTGFDNFSDTAHHAFTALAATVLQNRKLLKETMTKYGFAIFETEWWHYFWPDVQRYEILDLKFEELKKHLPVN